MRKASPSVGMASPTTKANLVHGSGKMTWSQKIEKTAGTQNLLSRFEAHEKRMPQPNFNFKLHDTDIEESFDSFKNGFASLRDYLIALKSSTSSILESETQKDMHEKITSSWYKLKQEWEEVNAAGEALLKDRNTSSMTLLPSLIPENPAHKDVHFVNQRLLDDEFSIAQFSKDIVVSSSLAILAIFAFTTVYFCVARALELYSTFLLRLF